MDERTAYFTFLRLHTSEALLSPAARHPVNYGGLYGIDQTVYLSEEEEEIAKVLSSHVQWTDGKAPDVGVEQKADTDEVPASQETDSAESEVSEATRAESIFDVTKKLDELENKVARVTEIKETLSHLAGNVWGLGSCILTRAIVYLLKYDALPGSEDAERAMAESDRAISNNINICLKTLFSAIDTTVQGIMPDFREMLSSMDSGQLADTMNHVRLAVRYHIVDGYYRAFVDARARWARKSPNDSIEKIPANTIERFTKYFLTGAARSELRSYGRGVLYTVDNQHRDGLCNPSEDKIKPVDRALARATLKTHSAFRDVSAGMTEYALLSLTDYGDVRRPKPAQVSITIDNMVSKAITYMQHASFFNECRLEEEINTKTSALSKKAKSILDEKLTALSPEDTGEIIKCQTEWKKYEHKHGHPVHFWDLSATILAKLVRLSLIEAVATLKTEGI